MQPKQTGRGLSRSLVVGSARRSAGNTDRRENDPPLDGAHTRLGLVPFISRPSWQPGVLRPCSVLRSYYAALCLVAAEGCAGSIHSASQGTMPSTGIGRSSLKEE